MRFIFGLGTAILAAGVFGGSVQAQNQEISGISVPPSYLCHRAPGTVVIDGRIDSAEWAGAEWTHDFLDIRGADYPVQPRLRTRARLMWDDTHLYIAAQIEEPDLWATYTQRESVIFHEHDFELFLDVRGDGELYMEYEMNALGTQWDLMLTKAYSRGGIPINGWNINGLRSAVGLDGTLNDPSDRDGGWTVELAIPLASVTEVRQAQGGRRPQGVQAGEVWRLNFSRVEWTLDVVDGQYRKRPDTPEDNWVWAPTGRVNIHLPERWGYLRFVE